MKVLSLFDGLSGGRIALERAGIHVDEYYASEIDKYAQIVSEANYPDIVRLGDVQTINYQMLPKIDLLIGGSPCQGFSFAGKQLNFSDPRSALFFEFVHALKTLKPKYFMLENVRMKKEIQHEISRLLGVEPVCINSSLLSAQNRVRYYWTNIPGVKQPEDKGLILVDVLEDGSKKVGRITGRYLIDGKRQDAKMKTAGLTTQRLEIRSDNRSGCLSTVQKDNVVVREKSKCLRVGGRNSPIGCKQEGAIPFCTLKPRGNNPGGVRAKNGKTPSMTANCWQHNVHVHDGYETRRFTPVECERLQTLEDNYTNHVSNSQRYKMIGNGWTIDVIVHIFKGLTM
jgi:DNA (cytosine-5)-methyltransferase 3A